MSQEYLVVFDLDGTLNISHLFSIPAFRDTLKQYTKRAFSDDEIYNTIGMTWNDYTKIFLPDADGETLKRFKKDFSDSENRYMDIYAKSYDGIPEMLKALKNGGFKTGICSNSSERYITRVLKTLGIFEYIDEISPLLPEVTKRETLKILLDRVNPAAAVMVGDRIYDMQAAEHNGIDFIGCRYGYGKNELDNCQNIAENSTDLLNKIMEWKKNV